MLKWFGLPGETPASPEDFHAPEEIVGRIDETVQLYDAPLLPQIEYLVDTAMRPAGGFHDLPPARAIDPEATTRVKSTLVEQNRHLYEQALAIRGISINLDSLPPRLYQDESGSLFDARLLRTREDVALLVTYLLDNDKEGNRVGFTPQLILSSVIIDQFDNTHPAAEPPQISEVA